MPVMAPTVVSLLLLVIGVLSSVLFTFVAGYLDAADYMVELWTLWLIEVPFIVFWAIITRKAGWRNSLLYVLLGTALAYVMFLPDQSVTIAVNLKAGLTGIILGMPLVLKGSFSRRMSAVMAPGIVFSLIFGLPVIMRGVSPEIIERFRTEALEMYKAFMTPDDALNASNNAIEIFKSIFKAGFAVLFIGSILYSWMAFHLSRYAMVRFGEIPEEVAAFSTFKLPFHAVWLFLLSFGLILTEYAPTFSIALNVLVIMSVLYLLQGFAVVMYHMNRLNLGRLPRIMFWLIFFFTIVFTGVFLIFIGLMDNWFTLRMTGTEHSSNDNGEV